jgi:VWFA-related protein
MRAAIAGCLIVLLQIIAWGQDAPSRQNPPPEPPTPQQPTFRAGVRVVRVDVTVTGRDAQPVADLTADDFQVREDGLPQTIQSFQFLRLTGTLAPGDDTSLAIRSPEHAAQEAAREDVRLMVIFLDDYHLRYGPQFDARLKQMLRGFIQAEMRPTDLFAVMGPLTPLSDLRLTRDKQVLFERIDRVQGRLGGFVPPRSVLEESHLRLSEAGRARIRAQITLSALESLVVHLGGLREGRKSVLLIGEGPPMRADRMELYDRTRDVVTAANTSNVIIHTLDPRELSVSRTVRDTNWALAADTGGRTLEQSNDYTRGLRAVMADASAYYLLGYVPEREAAGKFHKIDVRVHRKGVRVLARKGYWTPKAEDLRSRWLVKVPPSEITDALSLLKEPRRTVREWVSVGPVDAGHSLVTLACAAAPSGSGRALGDMQVQLLNADGTLAQTFPGQPAPDGALWLASFRLSPGSHTVRVLVQDADHQALDSWTRQLRVAPAGDVAARLGTPAVYQPRTVADHRALAAGAEALPTLVREFRRTDRVWVRLPMVPGAVDPDVRAELVNRQGDTLMALRVVRPEAGGFPQLELPLANLARAEYVLRLRASFDGATVSRLVPFAVVP